jgi:hypothetical protein
MTKPKTPADVISASLTLVGYDVRPEDVTSTLGVQPTSTDVTHFPAKFVGSAVCGGRDCGMWSYKTSVVVATSDVGEHLRHLLHLFRPLRSRIEEFNPRLRVFIHLRSRSTNGISPRIEPDCIAGMAELGACFTVELINNR